MFFAVCEACAYRLRVCHLLCERLLRRPLLHRLYIITSRRTGIAFRHTISPHVASASLVKAWEGHPRRVEVHGIGGRTEEVGGGGWSFSLFSGGRSAFVQRYHLGFGVGNRGFVIGEVLNVVNSSSREALILLRRSAWRPALLRPTRLSSRRNLNFRKTSSHSAGRSRTRMLMEAWPKDDESSITLRLAPPLRLEADGSGNPRDVWLKEDETSDITLRLVPLQAEDSEKGPPSKKSRKHCLRIDCQEQGQSSNKNSDQGAAIATFHVHSAYLRRCQYFDACLAERWSNNDLPLDLTLEARCHPQAYLKCMQLLYGPEVSTSSFESVAHAIEVLPVAAQLVFQECVDTCMRYLAVMPWNAVNLSEIRSAVAAFQIAPTPDLAARLGTFGTLARDSSLDALKRVLETLLLKCMRMDQPELIEAKVLENRSAFERLLKVSMRGSTMSKSVVGLVKGVMYEALRRAVEDFRQHCRIPHLYKDEEFSIAGKGLFWLLISLVDFGIAEEAARTIFIDRSFSQMLFGIWPHISPNYSYSGLNFVQDTCNVLVRYLEIVAKGQIWLENSVRLALVDAWLPELVAIDFCIFEATKKSVDKALNGVLRTLPPLEQEPYLSKWPTQNWPNLSEAFDAWCSTMCSNLAFLENNDQ